MQGDLASIKGCQEDLIKALDFYEKSTEYEHYREQEAAVVSLFKKYPKNDDLTSVLLKVCVLDSFYSINLRVHGIYKMAKHIHGLGLDKALQNGDVSAIERVANFTNSNGKQVNLYSFASKYCFHHNNEKYVIYDKYVNKSLCEFNGLSDDKGNSFKFIVSHLKDYENLVKIIDDFRIFFNFKQYDNREIDHMLWVYGKEKDNKEKK
ncbi:hypothetical protein ELQ16_07450 [Campylobacter sp. US33a]|nr:hypothetical protein ELQ16_07450 [Campylobacter sp. US33a]